MDRFARLPSSVLALAVVVAALVGLGAGTVSCSEESTATLVPTTTVSGGGSGGQGGAAAGHGGTGLETPTEFADFPEDPVLEDGVSSELPGLFAATPGSDTGGPCLTEPTLDAMVPRNWTPLFFEWQAPAGQNVFELRLSVDNQVNDLVVYTTASSYGLSSATWTALAEHSGGRSVALTLRGATLEGDSLSGEPSLGASGEIHIAPVGAPGSVVYWEASSGTAFEGFQIGDAAPVTVLTPASAGTTSTGGTTTCISCHASSPDGELIIYTRDADDATRSIDVRMVDGSGGPSANDVSATALTLLGRHKQAVPAISAAHYEPGDRVVLTVLQDLTLTNNLSELAWTDLQAADTGDWGILARTGDSGGVTSPSWRHDGTAIAYVSSDTAGEGVIAGGAMDVYIVPYNDRAGGTATPLAGASDPTLKEFYPVYSPNDAWIAFNRTAEDVSSYNQPSAELFIVPAEGGQATRLSANDPPACTGLTSPGLTNSWPRWAPTSTDASGDRYYWLVFSSKRRHADNAAPGDEAIPQLYIAAVVTTVAAGVETLKRDYPALHVRSQDRSERNHTPAWEYFVVDQIPR